MDIMKRERKERSNQQIDFRRGGFMIDFHSHILPDVDDGSKDEIMTSKMLAKSLEENVDVICATPHFIPEEYEIARNDYNEVFQKIAAKNNDIKIAVGLEVYVNPNLVKLYKSKKIWGINNTKYLLIELPMDDFPIYVENLFYNLHAEGVNPIIAHPERNSRIMNNVDLLINLVNEGTIVQMNSGSLLGIYGSQVKKFAERLVSMNLVHVLGSDAHNDSTRTTRLKEGFDIINKTNPKLYGWILENERLIISGKEINDIPEIKIKKPGLFDKLFKR